MLTEDAPKTDNSHSLADLNSKAEKIIAKSTAKASAVAAIPMAGIDLAGLCVVQIHMLHKLHAVYASEDGDSLDFVLPAIIGTGIAGLIYQLTSNLDERLHVHTLFPEAVIKAGIAGLITQSLGELYTLHLQSGAPTNLLSGKEVMQYVKSQWASDRYAADNLISGIVKQVTDQYL